MLSAQGLVDVGEVVGHVGTALHPSPLHSFLNSN